MVGEVEVTVAGQRGILFFREDRVIFHLPSFSAARVILRQPIPSLRWLHHGLSFVEIAVHAQIGNRQPVALFPKPSWIVRFLLPAKAAKISGETR